MVSVGIDWATWFSTCQHVPSKVVPFLLVFNLAMPASFQVAVSENGVYPHSGHFDEIMMVDQWIE